MASHVKYSELKLSAEFKRDYVQGLALFAFFFILAAEILLAISIPWYLGRENAMADEVARLNLFKEFDTLRGIINGGIRSTRNNLYISELKVAKWDADKMADYLRVNQKLLTPEEVAEMRQRVRDMRSAIACSRGRGSISQENVLNTNNYINSLIPKNHGGKNGK